MNPFIVSVHLCICAAHRLALTTSQAAKEIAYLTKFMEMLYAVYNYFHNSAVRSAKLHQVQAALEEPVRSYKEVFSVRWLSLYNAVDSVVQSWQSHQTTLGDEVASKGNPAARGILTFTSQFIFLATCFFLLDSLSVLIKVIKVFQSSIQPITQSAISALESQVVTPGPSLARFLASAQDKCEEYLGCQVADSTQQRTQFTDLKKKFIEQLVSNIKQRFPDEDVGVLSAMTILDMENLPSVDDLAEYGVEKLELLLTHYGVEKEGKAAFIDAGTCTCREEWMLLKQLVSKNYPGMKMKDLWHILAEKYSDTFPQMLKLTSAAMAVPVLSADCERGFSACIKCRLRKRFQHTESNKKEPTQWPWIKTPRHANENQHGGGSYTRL